MRRRLSITTHSTRSHLQLLHGRPPSTTLQRTLRFRHVKQARAARLFAGLGFWLSAGVVFDGRFLEGVAASIFARELGFSSHGDVHTGPVDSFSVDGLGEGVHCDPSPESDIVKKVNMMLRML